MASTKTPPQTHPGWDTSYKSCLCLLLTVFALTLLVLLVAILVPGKPRHHGKWPSVPKDFDPELYERLMQEYRARTPTITTLKTTLRGLDGTTTIHQPVKKWHKIPNKMTTIEDVEISTDESTKPVHFKLDQDSTHPIRGPEETFQFSTPQELTEKGDNIWTAQSESSVGYDPFYNENSEIMLEGKTTGEPYATTFSNYNEETNGNEELDTVPTLDLTQTEVSVAWTTPISFREIFPKRRDETHIVVDHSSPMQTEKTNEITDEDVASSPTSSRTTYIAEQQSALEDTVHNDQWYMFSISPTPQSNDPNFQEYFLAQDSTPVDGNNVFAQKTIIKEKIVEKECPNPKPPKICSTNICKRSASEMLALMDHTVDPCDDFYQYACNGLHLNRMKDRNSAEELLDKIKDFVAGDPLTIKFKQLYDSCFDFSEESYFSLRTFMEDIFNDTRYEGLDKAEALTELISTLLAQNPTGSNTRLMPLFDLTVDAYSAGSSSFLPTLTIPTEATLVASTNVVDQYEGLCLRKMTTENLSEKSVDAIYKTFLECTEDIGPYIINLNTTLYSSGVFDHLPKLNRSQKIITIEQCVQFDVFDSLGSLSKRSRREQFQTMQSNPAYLELEQLQTEYPQINWKRLLSNLFKEKISYVGKIRVMFKETLDKIFNFFDTFKFADIKNLLMVMFLHDLHMDVRAVEKHASSTYCLEISTTLMEDVAAKILASKINSKDLNHANEYISDMFERIRKRFIESLQTCTWLHDSQKQVLGEKLKKIKINANAYNLYFNDGVLSYRNNELELNNNFAENLLNLRRNKRRLMYDKVTNNPGSVWIHHYNPMGIDIFTMPERNEIVIPIGALSKYALKKRNYLQDYQNYAKLGFKISKAILSIFTPVNLYKILPDLIGNEDLQTFLETELADPPITKFENVFGIIVAKEDIKLTGDDRFSDDAALRLSFETFLNNSNSRHDPLIWLNLTKPQLFFMSFAQEYCRRVPPIPSLALEVAEDWSLPPYFRVNSILMNMVFFAESFTCRTGSSMNPEFKVNQFPHIEQPDVDYGKDQAIL